MREPSLSARRLDLRSSHVIGGIGAVPLDEGTGALAGESTSVDASSQAAPIARPGQFAAKDSVGEIAALFEIRDQCRHTLVDALAVRVEQDLSVVRLFVGRGNSGELRDLAGTGLLVGTYDLTNAMFAIAVSVFILASRSLVE